LEIALENPIKNKGEDSLKRSNFSSNIAKRINKYSGKEMLTIGLSGEWGSGKSSIINMMKEDIDENKYLVIEFNPWHFSTRKQLISDFFEQVSISLNLNDSSKEMKKLEKDLKLYSQLLKTASYIPSLSFLNLFSDILKGIGKSIGYSSEQKSTSLSEVKKNINTTLSNFPKKMLVIIDELDRLESNDLKEIFQLVRALGDFENMVYLLSYDEDKVKKIFETGEDYLEKIITLPIKVPAISKKKLNSLFIEKIKKTFKINFKDDYCLEIYQTIFEDNFSNIREIKRYLNLVKVNSKSIINNINIIDYLVISYLQYFKNDLYKLIIKNKENLLKLSEQDKAKNDLTLGYILKDLEDLKNKKNYKKILKIMFNKNKEHKFERRISTYKYFDCYFEYYFEGALPIENLNTFININDSKGKIEFLKNEKDLMLWFEHLDEIYSRLEAKEAYSILETFLSLIKSLFNGSEQQQAFNHLKDLTILLNDNSKIMKIISNIESSEGYELKPLIDYYSYIYIKIDIIKQAELKLYLKIILINTDSVDDLMDSFEDIKKLNIKLEPYIKKIIETDEGLLNYLEKLAKVIDGEMVPVTFDENDTPIDYEAEITKAITLENITDNISYDYVKSRVNQLDDNLIKKNKELIKLFENTWTEKEVTDYQCRNYDIPEEL